MKNKFIVCLIGLFAIISLILTGCMPQDANGLGDLYTNNIYPSPTNTYNLGSASLTWANIWTTNINGSPYSPGGVPALTNGHIFVGNALNVATDVSAGGDVSLANTGAFTVIGLQGVALPALSTGYLQYNVGTGLWSFGAGGSGITSIGVTTPTSLTGILTGNGSTVGSITDSSSNWNTAYTDRITSVSGSAPLTLTLGVNSITGSVDLSSKQNASSILSGISSLSWASGSPIVRMNGASSFTLDTNTYITGNQTITLGGILSGSGATSITASAASGYYMPSTSDRTAWNAKQAGSSVLTGLASLSYTSGSPFVTMTGAGSFGLDSTAYESTSALGSWAGTTNITTLGTITAGSWTGTAIAVLNGGTGATTALAARTNLGLAIGTNVQAYNSALDAVSAGTWGGDASIATLGTVTSGIWNGTALGTGYGGTGVANGSNNTITFTGNYTLGLTLSNNTSVTLPTTGTLSTLAGTETLTNKTLSEPILSKSFTAATTIVAGNAIYIGSNGQAYLAEANSTTTMPCIYIAITGNTAGNPVTCMSLGYITTGSWTAGGYIYVADNVAGGLTQTLPNTSGDIIMIVGVAVSSTEIAWQPIVTLTLQ
jgi:hypothetical protein